MIYSGWTVNDVAFDYHGKLIFKRADKKSSSDFPPDDLGPLDDLDAKDGSAKDQKAGPRPGVSRLGYHGLPPC